MLAENQNCNPRHSSSQNFKCVPPSGALMVVGSTSGAGKSTLVRAICASLARRSKKVAPFKAQNMSNFSAFCADGSEVSIAQALQATACQTAIEPRMNPVLLKPHSNTGSDLVVMGKKVSQVDALSYRQDVVGLKPVVLQAFQSLREDFSWVIAEGAGGAAEINLLDRDLVNLPLAYAAGVPAILVVDIERGGAFASAWGTYDLLPDHLRSQLIGVVFNRFRGDVSLLSSGLIELEARCGIPVLGVLPHLEHGSLAIEEDSLDMSASEREALMNSSRRTRCFDWSTFSFVAEEAASLDAVFALEPPSSKLERELLEKERFRALNELNALEKLLESENEMLANWLEESIDFEALLQTAASRVSSETAVGW